MGIKCKEETLMMWIRDGFQIRNWRWPVQCCLKGLIVNGPLGFSSIVLQLMWFLVQSESKLVNLKKPTSRLWEIRLKGIETMAIACMVYKILFWLRHFVFLTGYRQRLSMLLDQKISIAPTPPKKKLFSQRTERIQWRKSKALRGNVGPSNKQKRLAKVKCFLCCNVAAFKHKVEVAWRG